MAAGDHEEHQLRSTALQNAQSILLARQRAEDELLQAQDALREANQLLSNVLDSITDGFLAVNNSWCLTYLNERGEEILRPLEKSKKALLGKNFWAEFPALLGTPAEQHFLRSMAEKITIDFELYYPPLTGWFSVRSYPAKDGISVYFQDISQRKRAEEELRLQREWFQVTLSSIGDAVVTTDIQARVTFLNPIAEQMTGWKLAEATGRSLEEVFNIIHENTRLPAENPVRKVLREGIILGLANHTALIARDGRETAIEDSAAPIRDSAGNVTGAVMVFHDVTVGRVNETALRASEERYRTLFSSIGVAVFVCDRDARIQYYNQRAVELWGRQPKCGEERHCGSMTLYLPDGTLLPHAQSPIVEVLRTGNPIKNVEVSIERPDGSRLPVIVHFAPLKDPDGKVVGAVTSFDDITERKQAEDVLRRNEAELRALADSIPQLAWMAEANGFIFWYNQKWYEYTGTTLEQMAGWGWQTVHDPKILPLVVSRWQESITNGQSFEMEFPLRGADGLFRWFLTRVNPVRDIAGRVVRWFGTNTDIDERKRAREALQDETRLLELLNSTGTAIASKLDLQSLVQTVIDAATELSGAKLGTFHYNLHDEQEGALALIANSRVTNDAFAKFGVAPGTALFNATIAGDSVIRSADITIDPHYARMLKPADPSSEAAPIHSYLAVPVVSRSKEVIGGLFFGHPDIGFFSEKTERLIIGIAAQTAVAIDNARLYQAAQKEIAERRRAEEQLAGARDAAEQANQAKDHFLATLSHELRTPLTPVLAILTSLGEESMVPPALSNDLDTMRRNIELEARLIDDLLDLTRISQGKLELHPEQVVLGSLIENAINTCRPEIEAKKLQVCVNLDAAARTVIADGARLTQILWNLLKNSIKFTPEGGTITVQSRLRPARPTVPEQVTIEVHDTGIGISPEQIEKVFDAFEQGGRGITQQFGGLGLGLAICKAIAEAHRGTITALSDGLGRGSTFILSLPAGSLAEVPPPAAAPPQAGLSGDARPGRSDPAQRPLRILVVEDHVDTAKVLSRVLRHSGYEVMHAASLASALQAAARETQGAGIDLVISDLGLPDGSGLNLMRELSGKYGLRGIALSGYGMESDLAQASAAGFTRHLTKPVNIALLRNTITEITLARD